MGPASLQTQTVRMMRSSEMHPQTLLFSELVDQLCLSFTLVPSYLHELYQHMTHLHLGDTDVFSFGVETKQRHAWATGPQQPLSRAASAERGLASWW